MALDERDYHFYNLPADEQERRIQEAKSRFEKYLQADGEKKSGLTINWLIVGLIAVLLMFSVYLVIEMFRM